MAAVSMLLNTVGVGEAPDSPVDQTADNTQAYETEGLDRAGDAVDKAPSLLNEILSLPVPARASPTLEADPAGEAPAVSASQQWSLLSMEASWACVCVIQ